MKTTTNAQLKLPEYTDVIDIADINENFTKIDGHLGFYILSDAGIHGLRYNSARGRLEYYNFNNKEWLAATDETGASDSAVDTHNSSELAHTDIRGLVNDLTIRLNTLADSDDETLDQLSEIVEYIKSNKGLIDGITTSKVSVVDIVNNLTTNVYNKPLSAAQGVALKELIDKKSNDGHSHDAATASSSGFMTADMLNKLNGISEGANAYSHPTYTSRSSGLYKITVNNSGHVSGATKVTKADITSLGIPAQDTVYILPAAGADLGGVKTGGDVTISEGIITVNDNSHEHSNYATVDYVNNLIGEVEAVLAEADTLLGGD